MSQKTIDDEKKFVIKTYTKSELSKLYVVNRNTFCKWISPVIRNNPKEFPPEQGRRNRKLNPAQVAKIVEHLGEP